MNRPIPSRVYEPVNHETLTKFLLGKIAQLDRDEIKVDKADSISKLADKIIKGNLTAILERKRCHNSEPLEFFQTSLPQIEQQL